MDGLRAPVGDNTPEVYWRRRIVALVTIVFVIVIAVFLIISPKGDGPDSGPSGSPTAGPRDGESAAPQPSNTASGPACTTEQLTITVTANPFTSGSGALPVFDVALSNSGAAACVVDTSTGSSLVVWSGGESNRETYFSTDYCETDATIAAQQLTVEPGLVTQTQLTWNRQRTGEGCTTGATPGDGFYWVQVTLDGVVAEPAQFELTSV